MHVASVLPARRFAVYVRDRREDGGVQSPALTSDNSTNTMAGRFEKLEVRVDTPRGLTDQMVGPERENTQMHRRGQ